MKAQKQARASLVIIAYNDEAHVARAIRSVCEQTERNIEIICVDDGSADATCGIMRRWAEEDSRIRVITQPNAGILGARYAGLQQASGDYVLFLDSDDTLTAEAVFGRELRQEMAGRDRVLFVSHELNLTGAPIALLYLAEEIQKRGMAPVFIAPRDDPTQRRPSIDLAKREFGWAPRIGLRDGLQRTVEYFRDIV